MLFMHDADYGKRSIAKHTTKLGGVSVYTGRCPFCWVHWSRRNVHVGKFFILFTIGHDVTCARHFETVCVFTNENDRDDVGHYQ